MASLGGMLSRYKVHFLKTGKNPNAVTNPLSSNMQKKKAPAAANWSREGYRQVQGQPSVDLRSCEFTMSANGNFSFKRLGEFVAIYDKS